MVFFLFLLVACLLFALSFVVSLDLGISMTAFNGFVHVSLRHFSFRRSGSVAVASLVFA